MARYRLLEPFVTHEAQHLEAGVQIGNGTGYPHAYPDGSPRPPSKIMEPLDQEAKNFMESWKRSVWPPAHPEELAKPPAAKPPEKEPEEEEPEEEEPVKEKPARHTFTPMKKGR